MTLLITKLELYNKKRLETKRKAQSENAWVKEAAIAYATKQENLQMS